MRLRPLSLLVATLAGAAPLSLFAADTKAPAPITCVVELFTSQGCSSCPPADRLMKSYTEKDGVLALSFNVDIWDNLGWKDTLANPKYTQRQRSYAKMRGDGQVYTPQTVINGRAHAVGSDRGGIDGEIACTTREAKAQHVVLKVGADSDGLMIEAPASDTARTIAVDATLWLVKFTPRVEVAIKLGENAGSTVAYHNVVRELTPVGKWNGEAASLRLARAALSGCTSGTCAILLQQGGTGSILGAAWVPGVSGI